MENWFHTTWLHLASTDAGICLKICATKREIHLNCRSGTSLSVALHSHMCEMCEAVFLDFCSILLSPVI